MREKSHLTSLGSKRGGAIEYVDLARAKSEALVNNTCKQKKLNRVTLNGKGNENGIKINRSN